MKEHFKIIIGVVLIVLGIIAFCMTSTVYGSGAYIELNQYGGDAYTGIQNAAARTGNNVKGLTYVVVDIYENSLIFIGISLVAAGSLFITYDLVSNKKTAINSVCENKKIKEEN